MTKRVKKIGVALTVVLYNMPIPVKNELKNKPWIGKLLFTMYIIENIDNIIKKYEPRSPVVESPQYMIGKEVRKNNVE